LQKRLSGGGTGAGSAPEECHHLSGAANRPKIGRSKTGHECRGLQRCNLSPKLFGAAFGPRTGPFSWRDHRKLVAEARDLPSGTKRGLPKNGATERDPPRGPPLIDPAGMVWTTNLALSNVPHSRVSFPKTLPVLPPSFLAARFACGARTRQRQKNSGRKKNDRLDFRRRVNIHRDLATYFVVIATPIPWA